MAKKRIRIIQSATATAAGLLLTLGVGAPAQAADTITYTISAEEAREKAQSLDKGTALCNLIPGWGTAGCALDGSRPFANAIREAAAKDCGVEVRSTPTGSGLSYDKAENEYSVVC